MIAYGHFRREVVKIPRLSCHSVVFTKYSQNTCLYFYQQFSSKWIPTLFYISTGVSPTIRTICPEVFCKKGVLKNLAKIEGKHMCWSLFWIKLQALRPATLLKSDSTIGAFCEFCEIFKKTYFVEYLWTAPFVQMQNFRTIKI